MNRTKVAYAEPRGGASLDDFGTPVRTAKRSLGSQRPRLFFERARSASTREGSDSTGPARRQRSDAIALSGRLASAASKISVAFGSERYFATLKAGQRCAKLVRPVRVGAVERCLRFGPCTYADPASVVGLVGYDT